MTRGNMWDVLNTWKAQLLAAAERLAMIKRMNKLDQLYSVAYSFIGKDASPSDYAPDEYGCAESVSSILQKAFPELHFPTLVSTYEMCNYFVKSPSFAEIDSPVKGCIMIAATGTGNGRIENGHVAICGKNKSPDGTLWAMSNGSFTRTWEVNFTVGSFTRYYGVRGGMPIRFFILV